MPLRMPHDVRTSLAGKWPTKMPLNFPGKPSESTIRGPLSQRYPCFVGSSRGGDSQIHHFFYACQICTPPRSLALPANRRVLFVDTTGTGLSTVNKDARVPTSCRSATHKAPDIKPSQHQLPSLGGAGGPKIAVSSFIPRTSHDQAPTSTSTE